MLTGAGVVVGANVSPGARGDMVVGAAVGAGGSVRPPPSRLPGVGDGVVAPPTSPPPPPPPDSAGEGVVAGIVERAWCRSSSEPEGRAGRQHNRKDKGDS